MLIKKSWSRSVVGFKKPWVHARIQLICICIICVGRGGSLPVHSVAQVWRQINAEVVPALLLQVQRDVVHVPHVLLLVAQLPPTRRLTVSCLIRMVFKSRFYVSQSLRCRFLMLQ